MLEQLEQWLAPALYAVDMTTPPVGTPGSTSAVHVGQLTLDPSLPTSNGRRLIDAPNATEAIRRALAGEITATLNGPSATYPATATNIGLSTAQHLPYTLVPLSSPAGTWQLRLEDLAGMPGTPPDWDYDDRTWVLSAEVQSLPTVTITSATNGAETANGSQPVLFELTRTNPSAQNPAPPLAVAFTLGGTATPGADYAAPSPLTATFVAGQMTAVVALSVTDDEANEAPETVALALTPGQGYAVGSPTATAILADNDDTAPRTVSVRLLSSPGGTAGSTSATISGSLAPAADSYWATPQTDGSVQVDATTAAEAIGLAFEGDISVTFGGDSFVSEVSVSSVGRTVDARLPFVVVPTGGDVYELRLENLARFPVPADNDYNDRVWTFQVVVLAGGPLLPPPPPMAPPPPGVEQIVFETAKTDALADLGDAKASYLRVSKWKGAFELANDAPENIDKSVNVKPLDQWVYDDFDGIRVRYVEPAADTADPLINLPNQRDTRILRLWTTRGNETIESERNMTFVETGNATGVFRSKPLLLVADDMDDDWDFTSNAYNPFVDNTADDQTVQVALGDVVHLKREASVGRAAFERSKDVPAFAQINVRIYSLAAGAEPAAVNGVIPPPTPIVSDAGVQLQIDYLKALYAPLGIRVSVSKKNEYAPTWIPPGGQLQTFNPTVPYEIDPAATSPQKALQEGLMTNPRTRTADLPKPWPKYIHVYFVKEVEEALGFAYAPYRTFRSADARFDNTVVLGRRGVDTIPNDPHPILVDTLAHEVGHILKLRHVTDKLVTDPTLTAVEILRSKTRLMGSGDFADPDHLAGESVVGQVRFSEGEWTTVMAPKASGPGDAGKSNIGRGILKELPQG